MSAVSSPQKDPMVSATEEVLAAEVAEKLERDKDRKRRINLLKTIAKKLRRKTRFRVKNTEDWDNILRIKHLHVFIFSMIGLLSSIFLSYYKWNQRCYLDEDDNCILDPNGAYGKLFPNALRVTATTRNTEKNLGSVWAIMLAAQFALSFSTFVTLVLLGQYYTLRLTERRREWSGLEELDLIESAGSAEAGDDKRREFRASYDFWQSSLRWELLIESLLHIIHPIVWIETLDDPKGTSKAFQTAYEVTECFIFLRLYLVLRHLYINSEIYIFRDDIISSSKELQRSGYTVTASSTYKIMFYRNPGFMVGLSTFVAIVIFGFWMFVVERNGNIMFESLVDSYWFVWVTISTIGYGDMYATSATGRIVVLFIAGASLTILTVFSGIVTNLLSPTREQKYVQGYLEQKLADTEYRKAAINLITVVHHEKKERAKLRNPLPAYSKRSPEVYAAIKALRSARCAMRDSLGSAADPVVDTKLQRTIVLANCLNELLDRQGAQIVVLEDKILKATSLIKQRGTTKKNETRWGGSVKHAPAGTSFGGGSEVTENSDFL